MPVMCPGTADTTTGAGFSTAGRGAPPAASPGNRGLVCLWNPSIVSTSGILAPLPRGGRATRGPTSLHLRRGRVLAARAETARDLRDAGSLSRRPTRPRNGARRRAFPLVVPREEVPGQRRDATAQIKQNAKSRKARRRTPTRVRAMSAEPLVAASRGRFAAAVMRHRSVYRCTPSRRRVLVATPGCRLPRVFTNIRKTNTRDPLSARPSPRPDAAATTRRTLSSARATTGARKSVTSSPWTTRSSTTVPSAAPVDTPLAWRNGPSRSSSARRLAHWLFWWNTP